MKISTSIYSMIALMAFCSASHAENQICRQVAEKNVCKNYPTVISTHTDRVLDIRNSDNKLVPIYNEDMTPIAYMQPQSSTIIEMNSQNTNRLVKYRDAAGVWTYSNNLPENKNTPYQIIAAQ